MIGKVMKLAVPAAVGALAALQWRDAKRYSKIKQLSLGAGHPEVVPAEGARSYVQNPARSAADGTGDFDSARRGGPANVAPGPKNPGQARRG